MRPSRTARAILAAAAAATVALAAHADAAMLRLRPETGRAYRYVMVQEQDMTVSMGAFGTQQTHSTNTMDLRQTAREVGVGGDVVFDVVYDRIRMDVREGERSVASFDSADGASGEGDQMMGILVGKPLVMTMTDRGRIVRVEGLTAILDAALADMPDDPAAKPLADMMRASFNDEAMAGMFQQNAAVLPEDPVTLGSTWSFASAIDNPAIGRMQVSQEYVVAGFEDKLGRPCVKTDVAIAMDHDGDVPMFDQIKQIAAAQGEEIDMSIDIGRSEGSGTVWLDRETGMTVAMDLVSTMEMSMSFSGPGAADAPGGGAMTMTMGMTMHQTYALQPQAAEVAN